MEYECTRCKTKIYGMKENCPNCGERLYFCKKKGCEKQLMGDDHEYCGLHKTEKACKDKKTAKIVLFVIFFAPIAIFWFIFKDKLKDKLDISKLFKK